MALAEHQRNEESRRGVGGRPRCAVQVDMDSFAAQLRYYGFDDGSSAEVFYDRAMPRLLDLFARYGITATFFVVGSDVRSKAGEWLPRLQAAGHEIANHTQHHPYGMTRLPAEQRELELAMAEEAIASRIGERPVGFRSPGFHVDEALLELLEARGYWYDASVFPTTLALAVRVYQMLIRMRRPVQHGTMGRLTFLMAPRFPYRPSHRRLWRSDPTRRLIELPAPTLPILRLPFHATAHLAWGRAYFEFGLAWLGQGDLVFPMHGVDVLGPDRDPMDRRLLVYPGVRLPSAKKLRLLTRIFSAFSARYSFVTSRALAVAYGAGDPSNGVGALCPVTDN